MTVLQAVVAVGGGELGERETLPIDREIVRLTRKEAPRALFLPTASDDADSYIDTFEQVYGEIGCDTDVLKLVADTPDEPVIAEKIGAADLVYVGGGNTRKMMRVWAEYGVDVLLRDAYEQGAVVSGLSAGGICWFAAGHSDSESFDADGDDWAYVRVDGLGLVPGFVFCPHYHAEDRVDPFHEFMQEQAGMVGLAVDDCAAISIVDGQFRVLTAAADAAAYRVYGTGDGVREERIPAVQKYVPLHTLRRGSG